MRWDPLPTLSVLASAAICIGATAADLSPELLDATLANERGENATAPLVGDETFLRRVSLDLIGRNPNPRELDRLRQDAACRPAARRRVVDRLLGSPEFGRHWAGYWSDTIRHRVVPPKEVYPDYRPLERWLADEINRNASWGEVVRRLITATGRISESPEVTYLAYHSAQPTKLASETARIFLGLQVGCAECHDHPSGTWTMEEFHHFAAAFGKLEKTRAKGGAVDGVSYEPDRQYKMKVPGVERKVLSPQTLTGLPLDRDRPRVDLAHWLTAAASDWFARALVNRVWGELTGRGFQAELDSLGHPGLSSPSSADLPRTESLLAAAFVESNYDFKKLLRVIVLSRVYQSEAAELRGPSPRPGSFERARLRGDQVCNCLEQSLGISLATPSQSGAGVGRYRTHRDRIAHRFSHDPSLGRWTAEPTLGQSLLTMNSVELQAAVRADPASGTQLAELLIRYPDDHDAVTQLYRRVLARQVTSEEREVVAAYLRSVGDRYQAYEDLLWALINSTEFLTRE